MQNKIIRFVFTLFFISAALYSESTVVKIPVIGYKNFLSRTDSGTVTGYAYEYLKQIQQYTGWKYEVIEMTFSDASAALTKGLIDVLPGNQYTPERAAVWDYSALSMVEDGTVLCVLSG